MAKFILSPDAENDLVEIWNYIAEDNIDAADGLLGELETAMQRLTEMPGIGHSRTDLTPQQVLFWPVRNILIVYRHNSPLEIVRVLSGYRDIATLLN